MVTRRYIKDYKFSESVTARGGIRTEAVYVGKYYRFEDADGAAKSARLLLPGVLAAWLLFIAALLPRSGASRLMWVILPFAFSALPLGYMTDSAVYLWRRRGAVRLIRSETDKISKRLPVCAFWVLVLAGVAVIALAVTAMAAPEKVNVYDLIFGAGFARRETLRCAECPAED